MNVKQVQSSGECSSCDRSLLLYVEELCIVGRAAYDSNAVKPLGELEDSRGEDFGEVNYTAAAGVQAWKTRWHGYKSQVNKTTRLHVLDGKDAQQEVQFKGEGTFTSQNVALKAGV